MADLLRDQRAPLAVIAVSTLLLVPVGALAGRTDWPVYVAVIGVGSVAVGALHLRVGLSQATIWGMVAFGVGHLLGGLIPVGDSVLYDAWLIEPWLRVDNVQHAVGLGVVGRATWEALEHRLAPLPHHRPAVAMWVVVLGASAAGAFNEVLEYPVTLVTDDHFIGGYDNTARDLIFNLLGGIGFGWWLRRRLASESATQVGQLAELRRRLDDDPLERGRDLEKRPGAA